MEQDINTASVADIFVEQAQAEMNVMVSIAESYSKEAYFDEFVQEGAIKDSATVAKGSKYEGKIKRIVAFIPRFIANFFKILIAKIRNIGNPIAALMKKAKSVTEKDKYVLPVSKETIGFAQTVLKEVTDIVKDIDEIAERMINTSGANMYSDEKPFMDSLKNINNLIDKLESYDVAANAKKYHDDWVKAVEESHAMRDELAKGKKTLTPGAASDEGPYPVPVKPTMPDIAELNEKTEKFVTVAEYEKFAKDYLEVKEELEPAIKEELKKVNAIKDNRIKSETTKSNSGVEVTTYGDNNANYTKFITEWSKALSKLSAVFSKKLSDIEQVFGEVLKKTKVYTNKAEKAAEAKKKEENSVKYSGDDTFMIK